MDDHGVFRLEIMLGYSDNIEIDIEILAQRKQLESLLRIGSARKHYPDIDIRIFSLPPFRP